MSSTYNKPTDRRALLTSTDDKQKSSSSSKRTKCKIWIMSVILLVLVTTAAILFFIYDPFNILSSSTIARQNPGMIGLWPTYGGGLRNLQFAPNPDSIQISASNIHNLRIHCTYESPNGFGFMGYPTIDDENKSYFSDANGYITCVNLTDCRPCWRTRIAELLDYNESIQINYHDTLTIFQDSWNNKGLIFGAPSTTGFASTFPRGDGCWVIAVHLENGTFWWKVPIGTKNDVYTMGCGIHGFYIDGKYGYGPVLKVGEYNVEPPSRFLGKYIKIDIDTHELVDEWYPFDKQLTDEFDEYNKTYNGITMYGFPTIIDKYLIFGTANLWQVPYKIEQCILSNDDNNLDQYILLNESVEFDICGNDKTSNRYYRCLNKNIYPASVIILNKNTFNFTKGLQVQGLDVIYDTPYCVQNPRYSKYCPGYYLNKTIYQFNADITAIASYKSKTDNKLYGVVATKPSRLIIFEIPSGKIIVSRKFGPYIERASFNMAVHEEYMIGIVAINGVPTYSMWPYRYKLANNLTVCDTGTILAFNLTNGEMLWQMVNPYGNINESICFNDTIYGEYMDITELSDTNCETGDFEDDIENINVVIPPTSTHPYIPVQSENRARFRAPITIANDMVFIPSDSGDIWVVNVRNGSFIHHFTCPNKIYQENNNTIIYNRPGIKGGISIVHDRVVFHCGTYWDVVPAAVVNGNIFVSMKLVD